MPRPDLPPLRFIAATPRTAGAPALPAALTPGASRDGSAQPTLDTFLGSLRVDASWDVGTTARGADARRVEVAPDTRLLALETVDGATLFIRADALAERLYRLAATRPALQAADGSLDLTALRPRDTTNRGVGDWVWQRVTALTVGDDDLTRQALDTLAGSTGAAVETAVVDTASEAGAKAIVWAIETRGHNPPGLYPWRGDALDPHTRLVEGDPALAALATQPGLIFIHGTGSHTLGSFRDLPVSQSWGALGDAFGGRLFGFEHSTFSASPIDNALMLAQALPEGAIFSLVTHSRGGLVGDLLCLDTRPEQNDVLQRVIADYRPTPRARAATSSLAGADDFVRAEQDKLRQLIALLRARRFRIERYVRVACPARGTALLGDNLEIFLSGLLNLTRRAASGAVGNAVGASAGPLAGAAARAATDKGVAVLTRIVVEIANRRLQPELLPGIEAMLPDAAMGMLLGMAPARPGLPMAVIAGDIEGGGLAQRLGTLFTDWMFFDRAENDLVVDTASMYGGLAGQPGSDARAIFVQGANVDHFRYFRDDTLAADALALPAALLRWLTDATPHALPEWTTPAVPRLDAPFALATATSRDGSPPPIVVLIPGIMGSRLQASGESVWLDPPCLATGGLARIAMDRPGVTSAGLVAMGYGQLAQYLSHHHQVEVFDYDWRQPVTTLGAHLAQCLADLLAAHPDTPVRILAHSMGGLVVRAALAARPDLWDAIVARPEGRLVMLGTPHHGSHLFVATLLGLSDTIRTLARLDLRHDLQDILDIVAGFPGALHLLPAPGFVDTGTPAAHDYYAAQTWADLAAINDDVWFGSQLGGRPAAALLGKAAAFWASVADTRWVARAPERIACVFGQADNTPCGLFAPDNGGIGLRGTPEGDGSVTWSSAHLPGLPAERKWLMPVDHMGLTSTVGWFDEIEALLSRGAPRRLGPLPVSRGDGAPVVTDYRAGPPAGFPPAAEATARLLGGRLRPTATRGAQHTLKVSVAAMDLRFVQIPVLCGHYKGDPIAAAEAVIDRHLVEGALSQRQRLGIHTGEIGNATIVLMPRTPVERQRQSGRGAVVVGLGEMGQLTAEGVTEAVRGGVLRYLLHAAGRYGEEAASDADAADVPLALKLAALLVGTNSALQLDVAESVKAVTKGVLMANRDFANGGQGGNARRAFVGELQFVEVFRDTAISAAHAVAGLGAALGSELARLNLRLDTRAGLRIGEGVRARLSVSPFSDYWPRLVVCDANGSDEGAATPAADAPAIRYASRLKYVFMGDKARAESVTQIRQPGLVEQLCDDTLRSRSPTLYAREAGFGNTLFQLLVPVDFKAAARQTRNLLLMVDETTANLPWEMLEADGEPMVLGTRVVRQFVTPRFRRQVVRTDALTACVIANPATDGYHATFGGPDWKPALDASGHALPDALPDLAGAAAEGATVGRILEGAGYAITRVPPDSLASDVFTRLFARSYRILMVSAHGIHARRANDGSYRSGVVLSGGHLLSAAEIGQMESVPDLVFLNCCHLGKIDSSADSSGHRLAASLARELIDMGVRCVVAAGWEVNDEAARTFIETFFTQLAQAGASFGEAVTAARNATFTAHPDCNTWGAYQAYGDPAFQLKAASAPIPDDAPLQAPDELIDWIEQRRLDCRLALTAPHRGPAPTPDASYRRIVPRLKTRLRHVPDGWAGLPEVQHAVGRLHAEFGHAGFTAAREALLCAIGGDSSRGSVPIAAIEQLANLEAREAETLSADAATRKDALALIDGALARLQWLLGLAAAQPKAGRSASAPNAERWALLGSTFKRKAVVLMRAGKSWPRLRPLLEAARDAYGHGAGNPDEDNDWDPYRLLNHLQLDALLEGGADTARLADTCQRAANARFARSYGFFDAAMAADAELTRWLRQPGADAAALLAHYRDALAGVVASPRELDAVSRQLVVLGGFLRCRGVEGDAARATALEAVSTALTDAQAAPPRAGPQDGAA